MEALAIPLLLLVGGLLAVQSAANLQLAAGVGGPLPGAAVQLGVGAAVLVALTLVVGSGDAFGRLADAEAWHLLGGLGSAVYVLAGIVLLPRLGAIVTVGLFVAGQMAASLALDLTGALGVPREALTPAAVGGAVAVVAGIAAVVRAQGAQPAQQALRPWLALGVLAGVALPVQGAVNAQLRADVEAPVAAGAWSFLVAAAAMVLVLAARRERPSRVRPALPWWGWLGGLCGAAYVTSVFVLIPEIGVAPTVTLTIAGQQVASVLVDRYGLLRLPRRPVTGARLAGVAVLLAGVAVLQAA